jgi:hypothetical protein
MPLSSARCCRAKMLAPWSGYFTAVCLMPDARTNVIHHAHHYRTLICAPRFMVLFVRFVFTSDRCLRLLPPAVPDLPMPALIAAARARLLPSAGAKR